MNPTQLGIAAIIGAIAILLMSAMLNGLGWLVGFVLGNLLMFIATVYRLDRVFRELWRARFASPENISYFVRARDDKSSSGFDSDKSYESVVKSLGVELAEPLANHWPTRVFKGYHTQSGRDIAVKILWKTKGHDNEKNLEIEALRRLSGSSPHFVEFIDAKETDEYTVIVMELCKEGSLSKVLRNVLNDAAYSESLFCKPAYTGCMFKILEIFLQIAHGLIELHRHKLAHGDIKPQNILLADEDFGKGKMPCCKPHYTQLSRMFRLADFDIVRRMTAAGEFCTSEGRGTAGYRAPEIVKGQRCKVNGVKADTYSFGVMLYEAFTSEAYANMKHVRAANGQDYIIEETYIKLHDLGGPARVPLYGWWSVNPAILNVLRSFLRPNPDERGTLEDFVNLFSANYVGQRDITKTAAVPFEYPSASLFGRGNGVQTVNWIAEVNAEVESSQSTK